MSTGSRAPGSRRHSLLRAGFLLLLLVAAAVVWAVSYATSDAAADALRRVLQERASIALGHDLTVRRLAVESLAPPGISLHGVALTAHDGRVLAEIERVDARLGGGVSWRERFVPVDLVSLKAPRARVAWEGGKLRDYDALLARLRPDPAAPPRSRVAVALRHLDVAGGSVRLSVDPLGLEATLGGVFLQLDDPAAARPPGARTVRALPAPGRFRVDDVEVAFGAIRERASLREGTFSVDGGRVAFDDYALVVRGGEVLLRGEAPLRSEDPSGYRAEAEADVDLALLREAFPAAPEVRGLARARVVARGAAGPPAVSFEIDTEDASIRAQGRRRELVFKLGDAALRGRLDGEQVVLEPSTLRWGGGRVGAEGVMTLSGTLPFSASLVVEDVDLAQILDAVTVPRSWVSMGLTGGIDLSGAVRAPAGGLRASGRATLAVRDLIVRDGPWDALSRTAVLLHVPAARVATAIAIDPAGVHLVDGVVSGPHGSSLAVSTDFVFARPLGLRIHAVGRRFDLRDVRDTVVGLHVQGRGGVEVDIAGPTNDLDIVGGLELDDFVFLDWPFGRVQGDVHWHARGDLEFTRLRGQRERSTYEAEVRVLFADARRGGQRERLELDLDVLVPQGHARAEDLLPIFFGDRIPLRGAAHGRARFAGPPSALSGEVEARAEDVAFLWERFDSVELVGGMDAGDLVVREAFARKGDGVLVARGAVRRGGRLDLSARLGGVGVEQLAPVLDARLPLRGRLGGGVVVRGTIADPAVDGELALLGATWRGDPLGDSTLRFSLAHHEARAQGTLADGALLAAGQLALSGIWPYAFGVRTASDLSLDPFLPATVLARAEPVTASIGGELSGVGTLLDGWHTVRLDVPSFRLARAGHVVQADPRDPVVVTYDVGALRFRRARLSSPDGATDLGVEGWIRPGGPLDVDIAGRVDVAFLDLAADVFERVEARSLHVEQLRLKGTTQALEIEGAATLREALIKTIHFPHAVEIDRLRVSLRDRTIRLDELEGRLGGGTLERAEGSTIRLDRSGWRPRQYDLHVDCRGCNVRYPTFMPPARGDASMAFRGVAPDGLVLSGRVHVEEMTLRDTMNWQRSVLTFRERATVNLAGAAREALFGLDVALASDPGALRIVNNLGDLRGTARGLHVGGDTSRVLITGSVELNGGVFRYKGHEFQLEPGTAEFREGTEWFPWLEATMVTDVATRDEDYRVTLNASGRLDNPVLRSAAEPFLTEADINSLLLFGLTQEELERAELRDLVGSALGAAAGTYTESAAASVGQAVKGEGRSVLPDRVEIVPVYLDTTGSTTFWAVLTKEIVPDAVTVEAGVGLGGASRLGGVARMKVQVARNFFLEGSWVSDETSSRSYGNFGVDLKLELDLD